MYFYTHMNFVAFASPKLNFVAAFSLPAFINEITPMATKPINCIVVLHFIFIENIFFALLATCHVWEAHTSEERGEREKS